MKYSFKDICKKILIFICRHWWKFIIFSAAVSLFVLFLAMFGGPFSEQVYRSFVGIVGFMQVFTGIALAGLMLKIVARVAGYPKFIAESTQKPKSTQSTAQNKVQSSVKTQASKTQPAKMHSPKPTYKDEVYICNGEPNFVTLIIASGEAVDFIDVAGVKYNGNFYSILRPITPLPGMANDEALVYRVTRNGDRDSFSIVTDDRIINAVFNLYYQYA